jgi:hypothetical protein
MAVTGPDSEEAKRRASAALMRQVHNQPGQAAAAEQIRAAMPRFEARVDWLIGQMRTLRDTLPDADPAVLQGVFFQRVIASSEPDVIAATLLAAVWRLTDPDLPEVPDGQ